MIDGWWLAATACFKSIFLDDFYFWSKSIPFYSSWSILYLWCFNASIPTQLFIFLWCIYHSNIEMRMWDKIAKHCASYVCTFHTAVITHTCVYPKFCFAQPTHNSLSFAFECHLLYFMWKKLEWRKNRRSDIYLFMLTELRMRAKNIYRFYFTSSIFLFLFLFPVQSVCFHLCMNIFPRKVFWLSVPLLSSKLFLLWHRYVKICDQANEAYISVRLYIK